MPVSGFWCESDGIKIDHNPRGGSARGQSMLGGGTRRDTTYTTEPPTPHADRQATGCGAASLSVESGPMHHATPHAMYAT